MAHWPSRLPPLLALQAVTVYPVTGDPPSPVGLHRAVTWPAAGNTAVGALERAGAVGRASCARGDWPLVPIALVAATETHAVVPGVTPLIVHSSAPSVVHWATTVPSLLADQAVAV